MGDMFGAPMEGEQLDGTIAFETARCLMGE
jgi:hypothetical protein